MLMDAEVRVPPSYGIELPGLRKQNTRHTPPSTAILSKPRAKTFFVDFTAIFWRVLGKSENPAAKQCGEKDIHNRYAAIPYSIVFFQWWIARNQVRIRLRTV